MHFVFAAMWLRLMGAHILWLCPCLLTSLVSLNFEVLSCGYLYLGIKRANLTEILDGLVF